MRIGSALRAFAIALMLPALAAGCWITTTPEATETEKELCVAWRDSLPSRSRQDTERTRAEIGRAYDVFLAACPDYTLPF